MSIGELERLTRRYTWEILPLLGPDKDVPAPDVNTDGRVMAWLMDTVSMAHGEGITASVTGKPLAIGGTADHAGGTASGVVMCVRDMFEELGIELAGQRAVIQGFGKVGATARVPAALRRDARRRGQRRARRGREHRRARCRRAVGARHGHRYGGRVPGRRS